ncbi:TrgA family protein [Amylibacter sp. SFDW26]|uniref:TrgA family protein n=1 Tax=Amylibacter sp. SFDW26 TaxID=2652722 RepID=UPI0012623B93|nr:TrgA family protein [Amylibacter sp. SFDW26]KAB7616139.1 TrgA family protein [Amylibacter sp. SFDW26]
MPTAAKLVGAVFLAITATTVAYLYDELTAVFQGNVNFYAANAFLGFIVGWKALGPSPAYGGIKSIVAGLRATITLVFVAVVAHAIWHVIERLKGFYIKKIWGVFDSFMDASLNYIQILSDPVLIAALVIGGCISGIAAGLANRFWS